MPIDRGEQQLETTWEDKQLVDVLVAIVREKFDINLLLFIMSHLWELEKQLISGELGDPTS